MSAVLEAKPLSTRAALTWLAGIGVVLLAIALLGNAGIIFAILVTLMITGMPSCSATLSQSLPAFTIANFGVGIPQAFQTSLVRHLSMASAEAITPLPV